MISNVPISILFEIILYIIRRNQTREAEDEIVANKNAVNVRRFEDSNKNKIRGKFLCNRNLQIYYIFDLNDRVFCNWYQLKVNRTIVHEQRSLCIEMSVELTINNNLSTLFSFILWARSRSVSNNKTNFKNNLPFLKMAAVFFLTLPTINIDITAAIF